MELLGWKVINSKQSSGTSIQVFIKKVPLLGRVVKIQRPEIISTKVINKIAEKEKAAVTYVEPLSTMHCALLTRAGFLPAKNCFLPAKTIQIDLLKSEKELLSEMHPKTRYNIKVAQKRGVEVNESRDIESFVTLWHSSARRRGMFLGQKKEIESLWHAFGKKATLLFAHPHNLTLLHKSGNSPPIAAVFLISTPETAYYMYAASTKEGNKLFAPTLLAWEAIRLAKKRGCKIFDFEGIYDERYPQTKNWKGFTRFKEGFGGTVVTYPGTFVKYYNPIAKLLRL